MKIERHRLKRNHYAIRTAESSPSTRMRRLTNFLLKEIAVLLLMGSISVFCLHSTSSAFCKSWGKAVRTGTLDRRVIPEASGLVVSRKFPNRLYHINDSDNEPFFYITDLHGNNLQSIKIEGRLSPNADFEDMSLGPCFSQESCLFIGDIGDNVELLDLPSRETVEILVIEEQEIFPKSVAPIHRIVLTYPDHPHNAEGLAIHPNGDLYVLTKENLLDPTTSSKMFTLSRNQWENSHNEVQPLTLFGEIEIAAMVGPHSSQVGHLITSFDIAPDGSSFLILTYDQAVEIRFDLAKGSWKGSQNLKQGEDYHFIRLEALPQQEAISYLPHGQSFLYSSEVGSRIFSLLQGKGFVRRDSEIFRVECLND